MYIYIPSLVVSDIVIVDSVVVVEVCPILTWFDGILL